MRTISLAGLLVLLAAGCGSQVRMSMSLEETGTIADGDAVDQNYGGYRYDPYEFQVTPLDMVTVELEANGFDPVVTIQEVSTGAQLAEWDPACSADTALHCRAAAAGTWQARVYAMGDGTGPYTVKITVESDGP